MMISMAPRPVTARTQARRPATATIEPNSLRDVFKRLIVTHEVHTVDGGTLAVSELHMVAVEDYHRVRRSHRACLRQR